MSEQEQATEGAAVATQVAQQQATTQPQTNAVSHPRDVAALVMTRMNALNAKKDELTIAVKGLTDLTQQLMQAYAQHVQIIQQLSMRMKAMEDTTTSDGMNGQAVMPDAPSA